MSKTEETTDQKGALKALRLERKEWIKAAAAKVKEHNSALGAIRVILKDTPRTVPDIALATGLSTSKVMWYVASMKKYGEILEADHEESYFRYGLAGGEKEK